MRIAPLMIVVILITGCNMADRTFTTNYPGGNMIITNINIIPMDLEQMIYDTNVIIDNGMISKIGPDLVIDPSSYAKAIDGTGKFLIPGLYDMHVHINNRKEPLLFLANGVTTVQNMWGYEPGLLRLMGFPGQLKMRDRINQGKMPGPEIITAGPILEGTGMTQPFMKLIKDPEAGRKEVNKQFRRWMNQLSMKVIIGNR